MKKFISYQNQKVRLIGKIISINSDGKKYL